MTQNEFTQAVQGAMERVNKNPEAFCGMLSPCLESCDAENLSFVLSYTAQPWSENPNRVVHGGVIAAMLDTTMGALATISCGRRAATVSLQTSYLRPANVGDKLMISAHVVYLGRSIVHCEAKAWCDGRPDEYVASATGVFKGINI